MNSELQYILERELDTRDKRYMFLRILFPKEICHINLEGSPMMTTFNIISRFKKNGRLSQLEDSIKKFLK